MLKSIFLLHTKMLPHNYLVIGAWYKTNESQKVTSYLHVGPLKNIQHLYLYGRVTRLYGISIKYWMKIGWIIFSFSYLSHVSMEEAIFGFWRGGWAKNNATSCLGLQEKKLVLLCVNSGGCGWSDAFVRSWATLNLRRCWFICGFSLNCFCIFCKHTMCAAIWIKHLGIRIVARSKGCKIDVKAWPTIVSFRIGVWVFEFDSIRV